MRITVRRKSLATHIASDGKFKSGRLHPRWVDRATRVRWLKKLDLGTLKITGSAIVTRERSRQYIEATCVSCGETKEYLVDNIIAGKTSNCRCQRRLKYTDRRAKVLGERYDAINQRCNNPRNANYANYGGRGIECRLTREAFIKYMLTNHPHPSYKGVEIDRVDNDGHYEAGNIRLVDKSENLRNKSTSKTLTYSGITIVAADLWSYLRRDYPDFSLSKGTTAKLAAMGISVEDILSRKPRSRREDKVT